MVKNLEFVKIDYDGSVETRSHNMHVYYQIFNQKRQYLGMIRKVVVGQWVSWCFCPDFDDGLDLNNFICGDLWFSASCLDELREKIKELNSQMMAEYKVKDSKPSKQEELKIK